MEAARLKNGELGCRPSSGAVQHSPAIEMSSSSRKVLLGLICIKPATDFRDRESRMIWAGRWGGADPCKIGALGSIPSRSTIADVWGVGRHCAPVQTTSGPAFVRVARSGPSRGITWPPGGTPQTLDRGCRPKVGQRVANAQTGVRIPSTAPVSWSSAHGERLGLISPGERQISATARFDPLDDYQIAGSSGWPPRFIPVGMTVRFRPPLPTLPV